jgi:hypothetical protein
VRICDDFEIISGKGLTAFVRRGIMTILRETKQTGEKFGCKANRSLKIQTIDEGRYGVDLVPY